LGGLGRGGACALCGEPLTPTGMEIEIEFGRQGTTRWLETTVCIPDASRRGSYCATPSTPTLKPLQPRPPPI